MKRFYVEIVLFALICSFIASNSLSSGKNRSSSKLITQKPVYNGLGYANGDNRLKHSAVAQGLKAAPKKPQGVGLSAWGIIGVITGSLLLGTGLYYAVLFYPILCKKERKYDIMEVSPI